MESQNYSCVCGYKYEKEWDKNEPTQGDEPFKVLYIEGHRIKVSSDNTFEDDENVYLVGCPKCGTVKIGGEVWNS
jgi:rubredoxin